MSEGGWSPRPDDHLVEPFLGGLGVDAGGPAAEGTLRFCARLLLPAAVLGGAAILLGLLAGVG